MAMILSQPAFWILLGAAALFLVWLARLRRLRWWPAWLTRLLLASIILAGILYPQNNKPAQTLAQREIMLVDLSSALPAAELNQVRQQAEAWQKSGQNRIVVSYADHPAPVLNFDDWPAVDGRVSDPAAALNYAGYLLEGEKGKIILVSSGKTRDQAAVQTTLQQLSRDGHSVDILPEITALNPGDCYVGVIQAPSYLWEGTPFSITLPVYAPPGTAPDPKLTINDQVTDIKPAVLENGTYRFTIPAQATGMVTIGVSVALAGDPNPGNNSAYAALQVFATPKVLFISADPAKDARFIDMLKQSGLAFDVMAPEQAPGDIETLSVYKVVILSDILAVKLTDMQMVALRSFVSERSGGLIFLGGRNSFTLGGYKDSLLEPLLPVKLEPPPRPQRPPVTFLLVLDASSSMEMSFTWITPMALSREAAMRAIENLKSEDYLGLLTFSHVYSWSIPVRQIGDGLSLRQALDTISKISGFGGTEMYKALLEAATALKNMPSTAPAARHLLLLSDGNSADGSAAEFKSLASSIYQKYNTTISTIALGNDAFREVMAGIAEAGNGRYYFIDSPDALPRIMLDESRAGRSENIQAGFTNLILNESNHPLLSGMSEADLPVLSSYNALTSKKDLGAEDILISNNFQDPILSAWQFGSGRVMAWMSSATSDWMGSWNDPKNEQRFWTQVIRYALPNPAVGPVQAEAKVNETRLSVVTHMQNASGQAANLANITFSYVDGSGNIHHLPLSQSDLGTYELVLPRLPEGAYRAAVSYAYYSSEDSIELKGELALPFAVNYVPDAQPGVMSANQDLLNDWAQLGSGKMITVNDLLGSEQITPVDLPGSKASWLTVILLALVITWPLEIAIRRRWLPWK